MKPLTTGVFKTIFLMMMVLPQAHRAFLVTPGARNTRTIIWIGLGIELIGLLGMLTIVIYNRATKKQTKSIVPPTLVAPLPPGAVSPNSAGSANPWDAEEKS